MDIRSPWKYLSLAAMFFCILLAASCTEAVYAEIRLVDVEGKKYEEVKQVLVEIGWREKWKKEGKKREGFEYADSQKVYSFLDLEGKEKEVTIMMIIMGAHSFEQKDTELYRELADKLVEKFGDDVSFDRETSKGQPLF